MNYLYLDNFRGFKNTILPLKNVNFLVGENSTGKTSLLALIKSLMSPSFWVGIPTFDIEGAKLGNFKDIVSAGVKDRSYFRIGLFQGSKTDKDKHPDAYLITFKEKEGMPFVSRYSYMTQGKQVQVKFTSRILCRYESPYSLSSYNLREVENMFVSWISEHEKSTGRYRTLKGHFPRLGQSLGMLNSVLMGGGAAEVKKSSVSFSFGWITLFRDVVMLAPIRTRPKRTYDEYQTEFSPEGAHTPYLIKKYFRKRSDKERFLQFIRKFGEDSGLFKTIEIKNYGRAVTSPFELDVAINGTLLKIINVGYGVSQVLPIIVELFTRDKNTCFLIQQAEIHLHPKAQSAVGKVFYELAVLEKKCFLVETHSDFIIDSYRLKYREKESNKKPEGQIIYFERFEGGNRLFSIDISENGELPEEQPTGYRDFFIKEQMRMLGY